MDAATGKHLNTTTSGSIGAQTKAIKSNRTQEHTAGSLERAAGRMVLGTIERYSFSLRLGLVVFAMRLICGLNEQLDVNRTPGKTKSVGLDEEGTSSDLVFLQYQQQLSRT